MIANKPLKCWYIERLPNTSFNDALQVEVILDSMCYGLYIRRSVL